VVGDIGCVRSAGSAYLQHLDAARGDPLACSGFSAALIRMTTGEPLNVDIRTETSRRLGRYKADHRGSIKAA
jgi:hypothetical protein